jgi:two-component sensor histidine kinase
MPQLFAGDTATHASGRSPILESCIVGELTHRTANDFSCALAAIRGARQRSSEMNQDILLDRLTSKLEALAAIQRILQPPVQYQQMELSEQMQALCRAMVVARFAEKSIALRLNVGDVSLETGRGWRILMIVSELLVNVARHAFAHEGGTVFVSLFTCIDQVVCMVRDDDCGRSPSGAQCIGYGTSIVRMLVRDLGGELTSISSADGTTIELTIPRAPVPIVEVVSWSSPI